MIFLILPVPQRKYCIALILFCHSMAHPAVQQVSAEPEKEKTMMQTRQSILQLFIDTAELGSEWAMTDPAILVCALPCFDYLYQPLAH